jgi:hypothetical protein
MRYAAITLVLVCGCGPSIVEVECTQTSNVSEIQRIDAKTIKRLQYVASRDVSADTFVKMLSGYGDPKGYVPMAKLPFSDDDVDKRMLLTRHVWIKRTAEPVAVEISYAQEPIAPVAMATPVKDHESQTIIPGRGPLPMPEIATRKEPFRFPYWAIGMVIIGSVVGWAVISGRSVEHGSRRRAAISKARRRAREAA